MNIAIVDKTPTEHVLSLRGERERLNSIQLNWILSTNELQFHTIVECSERSYSKQPRFPATSVYPI